MEYDIPTTLATVTAAISGVVALLTAARLLSAELRNWRKTDKDGDRNER
jgi:hypothetical protein